MRVKMNLVDDICPVSEFRANSTSMIKKVKTEHRPLVLTQHGKSSAVLIDVRDYQEMKETLDFLSDISLARHQLASGNGISNTEAKKRIMKRFK